MFTTSRYASTAARNVAKNLARHAGFRYIARGKKTIQKMVHNARCSGETRLVLVSEKGLGFFAELIAIDEKGGWSWLKGIRYEIFLSDES